MSDSDDFSADQLLLEQCQAGNQAGWRQLQARLQERARHTLYHALGPDAANKALVEEIIEDVLCEVFFNKGPLQSCHAFGHGLEAFLDYLLHRAVNHYGQERARQHQHEVLLANAKLPELEVLNLPPAFQEELAQRLTATERKYLEWRQLPIAEGAPPCPFPESYARVLEHRILKKALALLYGD